MKKCLLIQLVLVGVAMLIGCKSAPPEKERVEPKSPLRCFEYFVDGGMEYENNDRWELKIDDDSCRVLIVRASRPDEYDTIAVSEEAFLKCDSIIHAIRLYETACRVDHSGWLDAGSESFSVSYEDSNEDFSGDYGERVDEVLDYLKSLCPDSTLEKRKYTPYVDPDELESDSVS